MTLVIVRLGAERELIGRALAAVPPARREEIGRLKSERAQEQKTVGEAIVRLAARACGVREGTIVRSERGKPSFAELPALCFNLSHSGEVVVAAFSDRPVGIDVERVVKRDFHAVAAGCFSPAEQKKIACSKAPLQEFYRLWTRRESIVKRRGEGLGGIRSVKVSGERVRSFALSEGELIPFGTGEAQYILSVCMSQGEKRNLSVHFCSAKEVLSAFCK